MEFFSFLGTPTITQQRAKQISAVTLLWLVIVTGSIFVFAFDPATPGNTFFPQCPFRLLTGWQCPGCGTLRGLHQLLHGHPLATFKLNPLLFVTLPFLLFALLVVTHSAITGRPRKTFHLPSRVIWGFLGVLLFFWVFRNTSLYPFVS